MSLIVNPINSNPSHDAEHTVYLGGTGSGKTSAVKFMGLVPKKGQVLFFDPYRNYSGQKFHGQMCHGFDDLAKFIKAAVHGRRVGCSFKLAYVPPKGACMSELEAFSAIAWALGDGHKTKLHVVIEELASCAETSGKLEGKTGELLRGGRQFGHVVHTIFQRGQEVPKTVTNQSSVWWLGAVNSGVDADWVAKQKGIHSNEVADLKSAKVNKRLIGKAIAEYLIVRDGIGNIERGALNCESGKLLSRNYR